jgi:hypothetical protein
VIYSIIVNKEVICFAPKYGWDKPFVKVSCCFVVRVLRDDHL